MAMQASVAVRNALLDAMETAIGASAVLKFFSGAQPANCAAANSGTELVSITLPSDWLSAAVNGVKSMLGTWAGTGLAAGNIGHYRIYAANGTTCHKQGSVTATGGGGDMTVDNVNVAVGQNVSVTSFAWTAPMA